MQTVRAIINDQYRECELPGPREEVIRGVRWGRFEELFTPAYWASQVWMRCDKFTNTSHRLGKTLQEEVAACLLGGYGIPAEIGLAAYDAVRNEGLLSKPGITQNQYELVLTQPLCIHDHLVRYRFARQKARYLSQAMALLWAHSPQDRSDTDFRDWLLELPGIGLKTASWITRNWLDSDNIAIIDIHLYRAGLLAGFFKETDRVEKHYREMEASFIAFTHAIGARPSVLDAVMWLDMKIAGNLVQTLLKERMQFIGSPANNLRPRQLGRRRAA